MAKLGWRPGWFCLSCAIETKVNAYDTENETVTPSETTEWKYIENKINPLQIFLKVTNYQCRKMNALLTYFV